ncbi:AAA family ATPase [Leptothrix ochracea]|uniref:AAA family ATPase n=1 Tax=Leptothrix ochracea TaxID=735331 RepID=UPI0034E29A79
MTPPGRLQRIQLKGFRSMRELDLELKSLNVLIGPNGVGKSNFISFFRFMNKLLDKDLQLYVRAQLGGADRTLYFGRKVTDQLQIDLRFSPNRYSAVLVPTADDGLVFKRESAFFYADDIAYQGGTKQISLATSGSFESGLPKMGTLTAAQHVSGYLSDWKVYHFHDTSETARMKGAYSVHATERLMPQGENLAAFLYSLRDSAAYTKVVKTVQRVAPFFHDFIFQLEPKDQIRLRWKHKGSDEYFDATMLSDGTLRFICLTTLLLQPKLPTILLLDEPELGLHPFAMQLLAGMMRSASESTQIIASTQSVTLANEFGWDDLVVVDQVDNASKFRRLQEQEVAHWLEQYRLGDIWQMNLLGGTPE